MPLTNVEVLEGGVSLRLDWADGVSAPFHAVWLRDNALDAADAQSPQRAAADYRARHSARHPHRKRRGERDGRSRRGLRARGQSGGLSRRMALCAPLRSTRYEENSGLDLAGDRAFGCRACRGSTSRLTTPGSPPTEQALGCWLADVRRYGFAVLGDVPTEPGTLCKVAELLGYVRETNYGRWFEVRAEVNPSNLAYTNLGLQAHTDNPYRDPVPTMQILACLENTVEGGNSIVVDGLAVAARLKAESRADSSSYPAIPPASNMPARRACGWSAKRPIIKLSPGEMIAIRFNNRSAAPVVDVPYDDMADFYAAYRRFAEILEDPAMEVTFTLQPGRALHCRQHPRPARQKSLLGDGETLAAGLLPGQGRAALDACRHRGGDAAGGRGMSRFGLDRATIVPFLADIFERRGAEDYLGEPVTVGTAHATGREARGGGGGAPTSWSPPPYCTTSATSPASSAPFRPTTWRTAPRRGGGGGARALLPAGGDGMRPPARSRQAFSLRHRPHLFCKALAGLRPYAVAAGRADERGGSDLVPPKPVLCGGRAGAPLGRRRQSAGHGDPGF